jgi:molecular chaperone GrpE
VEPVFASLLGTLEKAGLERIDPGGEPFDPNRHEAVMHESAAEGDDGPLVIDVLRRGYAWKGRVLRAAMVKVRG